MTGKESDAAAKPGREEAPQGAEDERYSYTYEGSKVPRFVIVLWAVFFVWGVYYLLRWIPESWREWFSR